MPQRFDCIRCKGKMWCGLPKCRVLEHYKNLIKTVTPIKGKEFIGSSPPGVFVSWKNYPNVSIAPLSSSEIEKNAFLFDFPEKWFGLSSEKIVSFREKLIRSNTKMNVHAATKPSKDLSLIQEMVLSKKPIQVEISLKKSPIPKLSFYSMNAPLGPSAPLEKIVLNENPSISRKIDSIVSDTDLLAVNAVKELFNSSVPVSKIYKLLSAGLLGKEKSRKIVPLRWSITATDSNISLELLKKIKTYSEIGVHKLFESHYFNNHFFVLLIPGKWMFEQLEALFPGKAWMLEKKRTKNYCRP